MIKRLAAILAAGALVFAGAATGGALMGSQSASADIPHSQTGEVVFCADDLLNVLGTVTLADNNITVIDAEQSETCPPGSISFTLNQEGQTGPQGATGPAGPQGDAGSQGPAGADGTDGVSGYEVVDDQDALTLAAGAVGTYTIDCPAGKEPLSGGWRGAVSIYVSTSMPDGNGGWFFRLRNLQGNSQDYDFYATCATV